MIALRLGLLGVADLASLVDLLVTQANIGGGRNLLLAGKKVSPLALLRDFTPFLRGIVVDETYFTALNSVRPADLSGGLTSPVRPNSRFSTSENGKSNCFAI